MRRRALLAGAAAASAAGPASLRAAQAQTRRVVILWGGSRSSNRTQEAAFRDGLQQHGWSLGNTLTVESRYADGRPERYAVLADELLALDPDVAVGSNTQTLAVLSARSSRLPIVSATANNPVADGFARSLAHPGGNVTGMALQLDELGPKHLELLIQLRPGLRQVAVLLDTSTPLQQGTNTRFVRLTREAAGARGVSMVIHRAPDLEKLDDALEGIAAQRADALVAVLSPALNARRRSLASGALRLQLPSIAFIDLYAEDGGLMSYGPSFAEALRRAAYFVDRILRGATPADLPVEQPTKFDLVLNLRTARALGLTFPRPLLVRAARTIE